MKSVVLVLVSGWAMAGCYSAGLYGYDRSYVPLDDEETHLEAARVPPYQEVRGSPRDFLRTPITWFGVVTAEEPGPGGRTVVHMEHRIHQDRHLCADMERETCRVTVSKRSEGTFTSVVALHPSDASGENRLQPGSLVRVYGTVTGEYDVQGGPMLRARYYRHWPRGQYVTTADQGRMRR